MQDGIRDAAGPYLRFADDNKTLATGNRASAVAFWDCATGKAVRKLAAPPHGLASFFTFNDGRLLALEGFDQQDVTDTSIRLWDVTANRLVRCFVGHQGLINCAMLSTDGRMLASRCEKSIRVWEVASGQERCRFEEPAPIHGQWTGTQFLAFSPDGRSLATCASDDPLARRWDLATGKEMPPLAGHRAWIGAIEFSANGRVLVTGSQDTTALVWEMASRERERPAVVLDRSELARFWDDLADRNAAKAYRAILGLAAAGDSGVQFVGEHLKPPPAIEAAMIDAWIAELDDPRFVVRERATAELIQAADQAEDVLHKQLERTQSAEVRQRIRHILDSAGEAIPMPERLRDLRALEVLEHIASPAARERLAAVAGGAPNANLTREARAALRRLDRSPSAPR